MLYKINSLQWEEIKEGCWYAEGINNKFYTLEIEEKYPGMILINGSLRLYFENIEDAKYLCQESFEAELRRYLSLAKSGIGE